MFTQEINQKQTQKALRAVCSWQGSQ